MSDWAEAYLHWLEAQVKVESHRTYTDLLTMMHAREFTWFVPNDDNRQRDGLDLRVEFLRECKVDLDIMSFGPCSVLEVLIGLSRRLAFMTDGTPEGWAWQLLLNLDLEYMTDPLSQRKVNRVNDKLDTLIQRTYNPDGTGGFFPLAWPEEDQRKVELWYQMGAYVNEIHPDY
jgi:hypothetical protein